jgi:hypothetical protein
MNFGSPTKMSALTPSNAGNYKPGRHRQTAPPGISRPMNRAAVRCMIFNTGRGNGSAGALWLPLVAEHAVLVNLAGGRLCAVLPK